MQVAHVRESSIQQFKNVFSGYIEEKKYAPGVLDSKIQLAFERAKSMFVIEGDDEFKGIILNCLKDICSLRPGRLLMKCISKTEYIAQDHTIGIFKGVPCNYEQVETEILNHRSCKNKLMCDCKEYETEITPKITINPKFNYKYNAIDENGKLISIRSKLFIALAHEIIHALHGLNNQFVHSENYFKNFDALEEQNTITGFKPEKISQNKKQNKIDLLCENIFLFSIGSPARIDHQSAKFQEQDYTTTEMSKSLDSYIEWIKEQLGEFLIPDGMEDNAEYMEKIIKKNFNNINLASYRLKEDSLFIVNLMKNQVIKELNENMQINFIELVKTILELPLSIDEKSKFLSKINEPIFSNAEINLLISTFLSAYLVKFAKIFEGLEINDCITNRMINDDHFKELKELRSFISMMRRISKNNNFDKNFTDFLSEMFKTLKCDLKFVEYADDWIRTYHPSGMLTASLNFSIK